MKSEGKDIFAKRVSVHPLSLSNDGEYVVEKKDMLKSGITNVNIRIEGVDPKTGIPFTRLKSA